MATVRAFGALRFTRRAGPIEQLVCPPYDIIGEEQRTAYLARNPHNIIRLELPREGEDPYRTAGHLLKEWVDGGVLACDERPGLYVYEESFEVGGQEKSVKGLVCACRLEEFDKGVILPHEETLSKAKTDRFNLMCATGCNFSSIYSLYSDEENAVYARIERLSGGGPEVDFADGDGIIHRVWKVEDPDEIAALCAALADKKLYIADGHHRYETALNYRSHLRAQGVEVDEGHPANCVMMTLVHMQHPGLVVFPTHRLVRDIAGFEADALLRGIREHFDVRPTVRGELERQLGRLADTGEKALGLYAAGRAWLLTLTAPEALRQLLPELSEVSRMLDVSVLHTLILERLLGIDKANMLAQKNLRYTRELGEAFAAVDGGEANCAFLLNPTKVEEIAAVAAAGEKMPQKSTYFYPKLITGHLMRRIAD